ncbi:MAG: PEP-CTERM sorting domain-containing protein [Planctomycetaceae bacterium]|nr:PEP-CTERM sorting domain-containing protein [Planctomycetaceae bacterium]
MLATALLGACLGGLHRHADAAVTASGDVSPAPPAGGGNVAATFRVGNTAVGSLAINAGTPLAVTGGSAIFGDTATGMGLVELDGFNSNFSTANDLTIGNAGLSSVKVLNFSKITLTDDLFLGIETTALGELLVQGLGSFTDVGDTVVVGSAGVGHIDVVHGGRIDADDTIFGQAAGGRGRVTVTGTGSRLIQTSSITLGDAGRGELNVLDQGLVTTTNALTGNAATGVGVATVSGSDSQWRITGFLNHGVAGLATLEVSAGGLVTMTGAMRMAIGSTAESHAVVSGANSLLAVGTTLTIGETGFSTLTVSGGGRVTSTNAVLGDNLGSRGAVVVDGVNSLWKITGTLDVSQPGEAELAITGGGRVVASDVVRIAAAGVLRLDEGRLEAGLTGLTNNGLVAGGGRVTGNVSNTATGSIRVAAGDALVLANSLSNAGAVDVAGGELETLAAVSNNADIDARFGATLRFGGAGLDNNSGAQLALTGGAIDVFGNVDNNLGAEIAVVGGASAVFHSAVTNNGTIFVSASSEIALLDNLAFVPSSTLGVQLASLVEEAEPTDAFGLVDVSGATTLGGNLTVSLATGFAAAVGDTFEILRASGGLAGTFASESLPSIGPGKALDVQYTPTSVLLAVVAAPGLTADFDDDGDVDAADLAKWKAGFGTASGATHMQGDADGNGAVDGTDFLAWQQQFGTTPAISATAAVPEPASVALAALAAVGCLAARRRA